VSDDEVKRLEKLMDRCQKISNRSSPSCCQAAGASAPTCTSAARVPARGARYSPLVAQRRGQPDAAQVCKPAERFIFCPGALDQQADGEQEYLWNGDWRRKAKVKSKKEKKPRKS